MNKIVTSSIIVIAALSFIVLISCNQKTATYIPLENFFKKPTKKSYQLSPDGKKYGYLATSNNKVTVFIVDIINKKTFDLSNIVKENIIKYLWTDSQTIVCQFNDSNYKEKIIKIEVESKTPHLIKHHEYDEFQLTDYLTKKNDEILIYAKSEKDAEWNLHRLNLKNYETELVSENLDNIVKRVFDHNDKYRIVLQEDGLKTYVLYRDNETESFRQLFFYNNVKEIFQPLFFCSNNENIYAYSNLNRDKVALIEYDPVTKKELKVIYQDPEFDLFGDDESDFVKFSEKNANLAYIFYTTEKRIYHFTDDNYQNLISGIQSKFPGQIVRIISSDKEERNHIIKISSDKLMGEYYLYDNNSDTLFFIENIYPWLEKKVLADKKPISFKSRDGFTVHGYLTLPISIEPVSLPLIVYPHGGPQWRDCWEMGRFTEIQMLANRGYAVLNVNFRGSTGYGKEFLTAGFKQNGLNVQNDITDGINYLIEQNIVDKNRIAIMGGSYGGYAVLAGLTFTPEIYSCGVDMFGVSNFFTFFNSMPPWFNKESLYETIGHPERDHNLLRKTSPIFHVDKIKAPLLIAQGGKDPIVSRSESDQMVDALQKNGIFVKYILKENEGHGYFYNEKNRIELWQSIEAFFKEYLVE